MASHVWTCQASRVREKERRRDTENVENFKETSKLRRSTSASAVFQLRGFAELSRAQIKSLEQWRWHRLPFLMATSACQSHADNLITGIECLILFV